MPLASSLHQEVGQLLHRLKKVEEKRALADKSWAEADAEEAAVRTRLAELGSGVAVNPKRVSALPPLPRSSRGQGDRVVALLRENPGVKAPWVAERVYGEDSTQNRQAAASLLWYLSTKGKAHHLEDGTWFVGPAEGRTMTK